MSINNGGPAFPVSPNKSDPEWAAARDGGMTMRDYFAAKTLQGIVSRGPADSEVVARLSYNYADAMLRAREAS